MLHDVLKHEGKIALICDEEDAKFIAYLVGSGISAALHAQMVEGWHSVLSKALDLDEEDYPTFISASGARGDFYTKMTWDKEAP